MGWLLLGLGSAFVAAFGLIIITGAPYLPTRKTQSQLALKMLNLKPGQTFIDLGCGDGRLLIIAARQGVKAVGYELNPFLAVLAWWKCRRYRRLVKIRCRSFWSADLKSADGIFVFLIGHYMNRLDKMIEKKRAGRCIKLVSYAFEIPGKKPIAKRHGMVLYDYPAIAKAP